VLVLLALIGVASVLSRQSNSHRLNSELRLCALITAVLTGYLCLARPTFAQYFLSVLPFMAILATGGLFAVATEVCPGIHSVWFVGALVGMFLFAGAKAVREHLTRPEKTWAEVEHVAEVVNEVTPPGSPVYCSDAAVYFAANRMPPSGLENNYTFQLDLPREEEEMLRILPHRKIVESIADGKFATAVAWSRKEVDSLRLGSAYADHRDFPGHFVYWHARRMETQSAQVAN
jgi:hypothetical protein